MTFGAAALCLVVGLLLIFLTVGILHVIGIILVALAVLAALWGAFGRGGYYSRRGGPPVV